jgi:hypothetical protein
MATALQAYKLRQVITELRNLDRLINERKHHVRFLSSASKNFDARDAVTVGNELEVENRSLELYLSGLVGSGRSYAAAIGNRPPLEVTPGQFTPSQGGELAELRALASKLPKQLTALRSELGSFRAESNKRLNDPGRWGDAALPNPVNDLVSLGQSILDLIRRIKKL